MNSTWIYSNVTNVPGYVYSPGEKAFLGIFPASIFILGYIMYRYIRKPLLNSETVANRLNAFYNLTTGIIWGQFFFHSLPNATTYGFFGYKLRSLFFLFGYGIMLGYDKLSRLTHDNIHFVAPSSTRITTDYTLNKSTQEEANYVIMEGDEDGSNSWRLTAEIKDLRKRRFIAYIYYFVTIFNTIFDGFFLIYNSENSPHFVLLIIFAGDKVMDSIALFTVLIHGKMYSSSDWRRKLFYFLFCGWPIVILLSVVPVFANISIDTISLIIGHISTGIFYGVFAGVMLWYANHFQHMESDPITKKQIRVSFVLFLVMALLSWTTGFFV